MRFIINNSNQKALEEYFASFPGIANNPIKSMFFNKINNDYTLPIGRDQAWKVIAPMCREVGLHGNYGTHSLRKTWGYHARMRGVDLALIMYKLNHESVAYTKRCLGITDDELQAVAERLNF